MSDFFVQHKICITYKNKFTAQSNKNSKTDILQNKFDILYLLWYNSEHNKSETAAVVSDTSYKGGAVMAEVISFTLLVLIIIVYIKR